MEDISYDAELVIRSGISPSLLTIRVKARSSWWQMKTGPLVFVGPEP
ncbi:hypothetical protein [Klebsiella pneumoniae]